MASRVGKSVSNCISCGDPCERNKKTTKAKCHTCRAYECRERTEVIRLRKLQEKGEPGVHQVKKRIVLPVLLETCNWEGCHTKITKWRKQYRGVCFHHEIELINKYGPKQTEFKKKEKDTFSVNNTNK